jgi:hypothetical protein
MRDVYESLIIKLKLRYHFKILIWMMDNIRMGIKEMGCEDLGWFHWQAVFKQGSEPFRSTKGGKFLVKLTFIFQIYMFRLVLFAVCIW